MSNISTLVTSTTAVTALSNLIVVSPQNVTGYAPQTGGIVNNTASSNQLPSLSPFNSLSALSSGTTSIAGLLPDQQPSLVFHYEGEQSVTIESDITDHFVENNTFVQDQIALKPEIIMTHGFIGELNDIAPVFLQPLKAVADKLTTISAYTPVISQTAIIAYNEAFFAYQVLINAANSVVNTASVLSNLGDGDSAETVIGNSGITYAKNQTKQQVAFQQFYAYWANRILFTVQTPWAVFQNMAIKSLRAIQDAETAVITDFEVTFKRIRTISSTAENSKAVQNRANAQQAQNVTTGNGQLGPTVSLPSIVIGV